VNRRAAAQRRSQAGGYAAPADRPRQRRSSEQPGSRAVARAMLHGVEVRDAVANGDGGLNFRGYASVTEHAYDMWDMFGPYTETIARGAFAETLGQNADVAFLLNHGGMTLARTTSGTLRLSEDDVGLLVDADLDPANSTVRDMASGLRRGDLSELSFAFRIVRGTWDPSYTAYRIEQVDMQRGDVSVVNYGANPDTFVLGSGDDVDVDALDDQQALALADRLTQRTAAARAAAAAPPGMSRAELDALAALAAPHPLTARADG
jgi:HK97 family phage prohead protease